MAFFLFLLFVWMFTIKYFTEEEYEEDIVCNLPPIQVSPRGTNPDLGITMSVDVPNHWGSGIKNYYKRQLIDDPLFYQIIEIVPSVDSLTIETIGEWIFGTPEYEGNVRFKPHQGSITIQVPMEAPAEVISLLRSVFPDETKVSSDSWHAPKIVKVNELSGDYHS